VNFAMPYCIHCGASNQAESVFCLSCGQTLYREALGTVSTKASGFRRIWRHIAVAAICVLVASLIIAFSIKKPEKMAREVEVAKVSPPSGTVSGDAVLTIVGTDRRGAAVSQGSGFILTADGLAGSNYHVLRGTTNAFAGCCNGRIFEITSVEGADLDKDLVVFQIQERGIPYKPHDLPTVTIGSSANLVVGAKVFAIGSPRGLENTVTDPALNRWNFPGQSSV
jgi:S1-C subfamily serine protease